MIWASEFHALWTKGRDLPYLRFIINNDAEITRARLADGPGRRSRFWHRVSPFSASTLQPDAVGRVNGRSHGDLWGHLAGANSFRTSGLALPEGMHRHDG